MSFLRQDLFDQICPLNHAQTISIKIVLISDLIHLFNVPYTVNIKMIERHTPFLVNLYDGKCRAADWFPDTKPLRNSLRKYSFSNTKISN